MKFSAIFTAAMATFAAAAPAPASEPASSADIVAREVDISGLNNLNGFRQDNLNYLLQLNSLDLNVFNQLGQVNNLNLGAFQHVFNVQVFDIQALLQLQQINLLVAFQQQGLFNNINLASLNLGALDLGLIANVQQVNLQQFVNGDVTGRVSQLAEQRGEFVVSS